MPGGRDVSTRRFTSNDASLPGASLVVGWSRPCLAVNALPGGQERRPYLADGFPGRWRRALAQPADLEQLFKTFAGTLAGEIAVR